MNTVQLTVVMLVCWGFGIWCGVSVCVAMFRHHRRPKSKSYYEWGD